MLTDLGPTTVSGTTLAVGVDNLSHTYPPPRSKGRAPDPHTSDSASHCPALDQVRFEIHPGEIFGILGPNGGGKTTLFRILSTMLRPMNNQGYVRLFGDDVIAQPTEARRHLGVVFQNPSLDIKLTAYENMVHQGRLYGLRGADLHDRIDQELGRVGLSERRDELVERFSGGMRRRVELAKALLHQPRLLLLDEPATGLDPGARRDIGQHLSNLREQYGITIALTTHLMDEAERCDRLAILAAGRIVALDTPTNLKAAIRGDVITVEATEDVHQLCQQITERFGPWPNQAPPTILDNKVHFEKSEGSRFVAELSAALPGRIRSITVGQPTLENVFLHLTGRSLWDENQ